MIGHTFLIWGARRAPEVHILTCDAADRYWRHIIHCHDAEFATACAFGEHTEYAVPCVQQAMEELALSYDGLHHDRIRYLAACLALGKPIDPEPDGGRHAILTPEPPRFPPTGDRINPRQLETAIP